MIIIINYIVLGMLSRSYKPNATKKIIHYLNNTIFVKKPI